MSPIGIGAGSSNSFSLTDDVILRVNGLWGRVACAVRSGAQAPSRGRGSGLARGRGTARQEPLVW